MKATQGKDPLWKRIAGGLIGIAVLLLVLAVAGSRGATAEQIGDWQQIFVASVSLILGALFAFANRDRVPVGLRNWYDKLGRYRRPVAFIVMVGALILILDAVL